MGFGGRAPGQPNSCAGSPLVRQAAPATSPWLGVGPLFAPRGASALGFRRPATLIFPKPVAPCCMIKVTIDRLSVERQTGFPADQDHVHDQKENAVPC